MADFHSPLNFVLLSAGVEGEKRNLTPKIAFYIGSGLAKLLADRFSKPANELKVSVRNHPFSSHATSPKA